MASSTGHWDQQAEWNPDPEDTADRDGRYVDPEDVVDDNPAFVGSFRADAEDLTYDIGHRRVEEYLPL